MFIRLFFGVLGLAFSLHALPSGGQVVEGQAAFIPSSDTLQVNANGKAILHWEQFNIASHESVHFIQSQSNQAILNRVTSDSVTQILGQLQANCPIYLINAHGIFIGNSAYIDTAGFLASTADLSNEAFWHGSELLFQDFGDGSIVNLGALRAPKGDVFLIARAIDNQGSIEAPHGNVVLATHEVMLRPDTKECVFIRVDEADPEDVGIKNSGKISALQVELNTHSPYEKAVCHTGSIEATASLEQNGRIYLVADKGETFVDGSLKARSGDVRVLGQKVLLEEHAYIDVSGSSGGTVLIGGDYQGANLNILNAEKTLIAPGALIHADADLDGNGGKVIVWSDQATFFYGKISVRGGSLGGNGGFAEVSGKRLEYRGFTDGVAPFGKAGTLLLDPNDIVIGAAATTGSFTGCGIPPSTYTITVATATNQILNTDLVTQLQSCNVTISTVGSGGAGPNSGSITVSSAVGAGSTWTAATTLTLTAASFISIFAAITNTSASTGFTAMNFTANGVGATTNPGILLSAGGLLTANGGDIILSGTSSATATASHGVLFNGGSIVTTAGNISITGLVPVGVTGGGIFGIQMNTLNGITSSTGNITLSGRSNSSGNAAFGVFSSQPLVTGTTGTLTFQNCVGGSGAGCRGVVLNVLSNGGSIIATNNISAGTGNTTGNAYGIEFDANVTSTNSGIQVTATAANVTAGSGAGVGIVFNGGTMSVTGSNTITLIGTGNQGVALNGGSITSANGNISVTGTGGMAGIYISAGTVSASGTGNIIGLGTGGAGTGGYGVFMTGASSLIQTTSSGIITLTGNGAGAGANAEGIGVFSSAKIQATGTGTVTLTGTASSMGGNSSRGIVVNGVSSTVSSNSGTITLNGTGGGTGTNSSGLEVSSGGKISSTSGLITGTLIGAAGTSGSTGIFVTGSGSLITTATGSGINLTGTGSGTTTSNQGISLAAGGGITTTNNAPITLVGTGSAFGTASDEGIFMTGASTTVSTVNGAIQLTGTAGGATTNGITVDSNATVVSSTSGLITLNSTNNNVAVQNNSSVKTQGIGGPGVNDISVTSKGVSVTGGASGSAVISTVNGNIALASTGPVVVTGSTLLNSFGQITVGNSANTVSIQMTGLTLTGGSGSGAFAEISTVGGLLTIDGSGPISLTGGTSTTAPAQIITKTNAIVGDAIRIGVNTLPTTLSLQGGLSANGAPAYIVSNVGGNIVCNTSGNWTISGGSSSTDSRAGIFTGLASGSGDISASGGAIAINGGSGIGTSGYAGLFTGLTSGSGNINITSATSISLTGGSSTGTNYARIATPAGGGTISLTTTGAGTSALTGGSGSNAAAQILTNAASGGDIIWNSNGPVSLFGSTSGGANAFASISTVNGNITMNGNALLTLTGGTSTGTLSQITVGNSSNQVNIQSVGISMSGGSGSGSFAEVSTNGGTLTIDGTTTASGAISLIEGSGATSDARIITKTTSFSTATTLIFIGQTLGHVPPTNITLTGGNGATATTLARAVIATDQGGNILSQITGNYTITGGITSNASGDGRAGFYTGIGFIGAASGSGNITLTGAGYTLTGGGSGAGNNSAEILTPTAGGLISLTSNGSPVSLQAGGATTSDARIESLASGNLIISNISTFTASGSSGTSARAIVATGLSGDITVTGTGNYTITGGTSGSDSRAGFYAGLAGGSGNINLTGAGFSLRGGLSGAGYNSAEIMAPAGGGAISLTSNNSAVTLVAQGATTSDARIITLGGGNIDVSSISSFSATGGSGTTSRAAVVTDTGGHIAVTGTGAYAINGGMGNIDSRAGFYTGLTSGSGDITLTGTSYTIIAGTSAGDARAGMYAGLTGGTSTGVGNITLTGTSYALTGGASGIGYNSAEILAPIGGGLITINSNGSPLSLNAGAATTSDARIESLASGNLHINAISTFTASGGSGTAARAIVATGQGGDITVTGTGNYSITGGTSGGDSRAGFYAGLAAGSGNINLTGTGFSLTGGASGAGYNSAEIITPIGGGGITLTSGATLIQLQGGGGSTSDARIITLGSGNIDITGSSAFSAVGGSGASSVADVNAQGTLTSDIGTGIYTLTGGSGTSSLARFTATGAVNLNAHDYTLTAGNSAAADGSNAVIQSTGMNTTVTLTSNNGGAITLNGGTAADQHSYIQTTAGVGTNPIILSCGPLSLNGSMTGGASQASAEVKTILGNIQINASGNVTLTGGSAINTDALIHSTMQGALTVNAQNLNIQGGIGAGTSGIVTQAGDIAITCSQNAQCAAPNAGAIVAIQTFGSDLTMTVGGSIDLSGSTILSTPAPTGNLLLIAGQNISVGSSARIIDNGTVNSTLTLVVDNAFPTAPGVGSGQFILDAGGTISAGAATPVKIYTARRPQNTILAPINGTPFVPGPFAVDTPTEQWGIYYPGGVYGGLAFTIYYKEPQPIPPGPPINPQHQILNNIAANIVQLSDLLPVFLPVLDVSRGHYHFQICDEVNGFECAPTFSPYGSFIFQDDVYWIGTDFFQTNENLLVRPNRS